MKDSSGAREKNVINNRDNTFFTRFHVILVMGCFFSVVGWSRVEAKDVVRETFSIQLNVFADKHNAEQFVAVMRTKGYHPYMVTFGDEKVLYKVLLGPYASKEKAQHEIQVLSQKEKMKAIIVPAIYPPKGPSGPETAPKAKPEPKPSDSSPAQTSKPTPVPEVVAAKDKKSSVAKTVSSPKAKNRKKIVAKKAEYDSVDVVVSLFLAWLKAWQGNDADSYLLFYSNDFKYSGSSLAAWKKARRFALGKNKNIAINFSDIQILQGKDTVEISFVQQYKSDKHSDRGHKTLVWKKEGDVWRIVREDWLPV